MFLQGNQSNLSAKVALTLGHLYLLHGLGGELDAEEVVQPRDGGPGVLHPPVVVDLDEVPRVEAAPPHHLLQPQLVEDHVLADDRPVARPHVTSPGLRLLVHRGQYCPWVPTIKINTNKLFFI